jgi:hypothetical protein
VLDRFRTDDSLDLARGIGDKIRKEIIPGLKLKRDSGKYIVLLREKAKRIGPIGFSPKINIQAPRLALMARLQLARTLADAL